MKRLSRNILIAVLAMNVDNSAAIANINKNPCSELISLTSVGQQQLTLETAYSLVQNVIKPYLPISPKNEEVVYTVKSGFALLATCHSKVRFERSLYYPIGLTGIKIGERDITTNGKSVPYSQVITNYGLRVYIPSSNLKKMEVDRAYIFSNSKESTQYCAGSPECSYKEGREIHPNSRYAILAKEDVPKLKADSGAGICNDYNIEPYSAGHKTTGEFYAKISTCIENSDGEKELSGALELAWADKVKQDVDNGVNGTFARLSPKIAEDVLSLLSLSNTKECTTEKVDEEVGTIGLATKSPDFMVEISGKGEKKITHTRKVPGDYYLRYATFSWNIDNKNDYAIEDISFTSKCQNLKPSTPLYISLHSKVFPEDSITIDVEKLSKNYIDFLGAGGFVKTNDIDDLRQGRFWRIVGSDQYFQWRGIVKWKLTNTKQIKDLLLPYNNNEKKLILDFLTHVLLASSFNYNTEEKPSF